MQTFTIGRDAGNQIVLNDALASRRHAELIVLDNHQAMIRDLNSSNGTFVNGNRITEYQLSPGDIIKCGGAFVNWSQYVFPREVNSQQTVYQPANMTQAYIPEQAANIFEKQYGLRDVFRYLLLRILSIGDLFKTIWNRIPSIVLLKALPIFVIIVFTLILNSKSWINGIYFPPILAGLFVFAICPFISFLLLSLPKKMVIDKVALASGVSGFIQFLSVLVWSISIWILESHHHSGSFFSHLLGWFGYDLFSTTVKIGMTIFIVNLAIAFVVLHYKYFVAIGYSRSVSVYLIVISAMLHLFLQLLSIYIIFLILKENSAFGGFF